MKPTILISVARIQERVMERLHCVYCEYANGLIAYAAEIAARTEQYWCPIKHAHKALGTHARY